MHHIWMNPIVINIYVRKKYKINRKIAPNTSAIAQRWDSFAHQIANFVHGNTDVAILTIFSLPLIFLTLGLFTILVNAAVVGLTIWIMPDVQMTFWGAIESCLLISLINYLVNLAMPDVK